MTANPLLDALGNAFAALGVTPGGFVYNSTNGLLSYTPTDTNITGANAALLVSTFNALSATVSPSYVMDAPGYSVVQICPGFAYTSPTLSAPGGYPGDPSLAIKALICSAFNDMSFIVLGAAPIPPPLGTVYTALSRGLIIGGDSIQAACGGAASSPTPYAIRYSGRQFNINPTNGVFAQEIDPPQGVFGGLSSWVPQMVDLLLDTLSIANVTSGNIAYGGTQLSDWVGSGTYAPRISQMLGWFKAQGFPLTMPALWGTLINDTRFGATAEQIQLRMAALVMEFRNAGHTGPIFFANGTIFNNGTANPTTHQALIDAVAVFPNCFLGPDYDMVPATDKYTDASGLNHQNYAGMTLWAQDWATLVAPHLV